MAENLQFVIQGIDQATAILSNVEGHVKDIAKSSDQANKQMETGFRRSSSSATELNQSFELMQKAVKAVGDAVTISINQFETLFSTSRSLVETFLTQERAVIGLNSAMKAQGQFTEAASKDLQAFASEMQNLSGVGDELILSQQVLLAQFTGFGPRLKEATQAAIALGASFPQITDPFRAMIQVMTTGSLRLGTMSIKISEAETEVGRLNDALKFIESTGASNTLEELAERGVFALDKLDAAVGDTREAVGRIIFESPSFQPFVQAANEALEEIQANVAANSIALGAAFGDLFTASLALALQSIQAIVDAIQFAVDSAQALVRTGQFIGVFASDIDGVKDAASDLAEEFALLRKGTSEFGSDLAGSEGKLANFAEAMNTLKTSREPTVGALEAVTRTVKELEDALAEANRRALETSGGLINIEGLQEGNIQGDLGAIQDAINAVIVEAGVLTEQIKDTGIQSAGAAELMNRITDALDSIQSSAGIEGILDGFQDRVRELKEEMLETGDAAKEAAQGFDSVGNAASQAAQSVDSAKSSLDQSAEEISAALDETFALLQRRGGALDIDITTDGGLDELRTKTLQLEVAFGAVADKGVGAVDEALAALVSTFGDLSDDDIAVIEGGLLDAAKAADAADESVQQLVKDISGLPGEKTLKLNLEQTATSVGAEATPGGGEVDFSTAITGLDRAGDRVESAGAGLEVSANTLGVSGDALGEVSRALAQAVSQVGAAAGDLSLAGGDLSGAADELGSTAASLQSALSGAAGELRTSGQALAVSANSLTQAALALIEAARSSKGSGGGGGGAQLGAIVTSPTQLLVGEGASDELILPLDQRGVGFLRQVLGGGGNVGGGGQSINLFFDSFRIEDLETIREAVGQALAQDLLDSQLSRI